MQSISFLRKHNYSFARYPNNVQNRGIGELKVTTDRPGPCMGMTASRTYNERYFALLGGVRKPPPAFPRWWKNGGAECRR